MNSNFLTRIFNTLNPFLFFRGTSIYAGIIANLIKGEQLPENAEITLRGSGVVPKKLRKKVGEPKILIKEGISSALTKHDIKKAIKFGIAPKSQMKLTKGNYQVRFENDAITIEPVKNEQVRGKVFVKSEARNDLRSYYQEETERLIELHRQGVPAVFSQTGDSLSDLRKKLVESCIEEAVRIAQDEIEKQHGVFSNQFALILCAGAVRGLSLFSDVDYIFVSAEEDETNIDNKNYFEILARKIQDILREIGMKADNLMERFSEGKITIISVCNVKAGFRKIKELDSITHALLDKKKIEIAGSEEVYELFCIQVEPCIYGGKNALNLKRWRRLYLRQYLRKKSIKSDALPNPSVWLRDFTIFYTLARHYMRCYCPNAQNTTKARQAHPVNSLFHAFEELELRSIIIPSAKRKLLEAYEFFMRLRNEAGLFYEGLERSIKLGDVQKISENLDYESKDVFLKFYKEYSNFIEGMLAQLRRRVGHSKWKLLFINLWGAVKIRWHPIVNYLLRGDAQVLIKPLKMEHGGVKLIFLCFISALAGWFSLP